MIYPAREHPSWLSHYDVTVPEGYCLRHLETGARGDQPSYRGLYLYEVGHERPVGYFMMNTDMKDDRVVHTIVLSPTAVGQKDHKMHDSDLATLLVRACAHDRLTGGAR